MRNMRKVKLIVHETYQSKCKSEDVFAVMFLPTSSAKYKIEIYVSGDSNATGKAVYVDNVMLTSGSDMTKYNFVNFGGFESYANTSSQTSIALTEKWTLTLRLVAGDRAGVEATLAALKAEILARSSVGIRWE